MIATNQIPAVGRYFKPRVFIVLPYASARECFIYDDSSVITMKANALFHFWLPLFLAATARATDAMKVSIGS
jgi:hypothetical protein